MGHFSDWDSVFAVQKTSITMIAAIFARTGMVRVVTSPVTGMVMSSAWMDTKTLKLTAQSVCWTSAAVS